MRKFRGKFSILILAVLLVSFYSTKIQAYERTAEGRQGEQREIVVGYVDYDHMVKEDEEGAFYGYGVTYLNELAKSTGWTYRFKKVEESGRISALINGEIDLLCNLHMDCAENKKLIFSKMESDIEYAMLCALKDNDEIFFNDYEAINGKRIGINKSTDLENSLIAYAKEYGITYEPMYFEDFGSMQKALEDKVIDIMLASSLRDAGNIKYVGKTVPIKEYFAVTRENADIMKKLDEADEKLKQERPFYNSVLYETYYGPPYQKLTGITREEYEFISKKETIRVACDANSYPIEYKNDVTGKYEGIYADALKLISEESGLEFEFVPLDDYSQAWQLVKDGKVDLLGGNFGNAMMAQRYGMVYSQSYLSAEYTMVGSKNKEIPTVPTIALPRNYIGIQGYFSEKEPDWHVILYDDVKACFEAVERGETDVTAVNSVFLQTVYNLNNYDSLRIVPNMTRSIPICIGIGNNHTEVLKSILDKTILQIPDEKFQKCITENAINVSYSPGIMDTLRSFLPHVMTGLFLLVSIAGLIIAKREKQFRHLAMTDSVTGIWNAAKFYKEAQELLDRNKEKEYVLITLDINRFKFINNDFGSRTGNKILCVLGDRIKENFGEYGYYARNTADVFFILMEAKDFNSDMLLPLSKEIYFDNNGKRQLYKIVIKAGIRMIMSEEEREDIRLYADQASLARKIVKDSANDDVAFYDEKIKEQMARDVAIENRMEKALENREFEVYLQPKYNLQTEEITGAEALVRWIEPDGRMVLPDMFIPLFEKNGFILKVDFFVYEEVMKRMAEWKKQGKKMISVSVNVSRVHIGTYDFFTKLNSLIEKYKIPKEYFELELTETIMGGERSMTKDFIHECKKQGYLVSIDDFGSGYSSLNLLKDLPVDILKIDKEFLNETEQSKRSSIIVEQVVEMAKRMEISTLCEGVETMRQAAFLKQIGCDMAQGYLFSRPIKMEDFEKMI